MSAGKTNEMPTTPGKSRDADYYSILGVARDATTEDISAAFSAAMKHHATKTDAERDMQAQQIKCSQAHDVLSDREKRLQYDLFGAEGVTGGVSDEDARAREMFEDSMFGVGGAAPKQRRVVGGAMFVNGGQLFQRSWAAADVAKMRQEMTEAFPMVEHDGGEGAASYTARTTLPHESAWEVKLVEAVDDCLFVNLQAEDKEGDSPSTLRIERTIALPSTARGPAWDALGAEVAVDDAGVLCVTVAREADMLASEAPPSDAALPEASAVAVTGISGSAEDKPDPVSAATSPLKDSVPRRTSPKRRVRRARRPQMEGMCAGFLSSKQQQAKTTPMDIDTSSEFVPPSVAKAPSLRKESPVSVREPDDGLSAMMWAQMDEFFGAEGHDSDAMDRGTWPDDVVLPKGFCPLSV